MTGPIVLTFPVQVPPGFRPSDGDGDGPDLRGDGKPCPCQDGDHRPRWGGGFDAGRAGKLHRAIDIMAAEGSLVVAPCDGVVPLRVAMTLDGKPGPHRGAGTGAKAGHYVCVTDARGWRWYVSHLRDASLVAPGDHVQAGQPLGYVGRTGNASYHTRTGKRGCPHAHVSLTRPPGMTQRELSRLRGPDGKPVRFQGDKVDCVPFLRPLYDAGGWRRP